MKQNLLFSLIILLGVTFSYGQRGSSSIAANVQIPTISEMLKSGGGCDTVGTYDPMTMTPTIYTASTGGYVAGHNGYGDLGKADYFAGPAVPSTVNGTVMMFSVAYAGTPTSAIDVKVWDGSTGSPGTELGSMSVLISSLDTAMPNVLMFPTPIAVTDDYFIGITFDYANGDTVALITSTDGEGPNSAWELWSDNTWYAYNDASSWGLDLSHAIWSIECVISGINESPASAGMSVYPSPVTDKLNIVLPAGIVSGSLQVIDITGKTVLSQELKSGNVIDVTSLTKGVYTLKVTSGENILQKKFMKE